MYANAIILRRWSTPGNISLRRWLCHAGLHSLPLIKKIVLKFNKQNAQNHGLYSFDPRKSLFYTVKLGFTGYKLILLFLLKNIECWYPLEPPCRGGYNKYHNLCFEHKYENYQNFSFESFHILVVKCSIYLNRRVMLLQNSKSRRQIIIIFIIARVPFVEHLQCSWMHITKTCLCNFDPLKPHFYIVKLGFTGVHIIFLFLFKYIDCGYWLELSRRGGSNEYPQSMF